MLRGMHARHLQCIDEQTAQRLQDMKKRRGAVHLHCFIMMRRVKMLGSGLRKWLTVLTASQAEDFFKSRLHTVCQTPLKGLPLATEVQAHHALLPKSKYPPRTPRVLTAEGKSKTSGLRHSHRSGKSIALIRRRMELDEAQRDLHLLLRARDTMEHMAEWKSE